MASVRASIVEQARTAASVLTVGADAIDARECPAIEQLVRCATLSEDAAQTLEWALDLLRAHGSDDTDHVACELLQAARARIAAQPPANPADDEAAPVHSLAWI